MVVRHEIKGMRLRGNGRRAFCECSGSRRRRFHGCRNRGCARWWVSRTGGGCDGNADMRAPLQPPQHPARAEQPESLAKLVPPARLCAST